MTVNDHQEPATDPSPWHPEADPQRLKVLGKLAEEAAELGAALARCIIQGIDEREPVTGKLNREWLEDEIADVLANIHVATEHLGLDKARMAARVERKAAYIQRWLDGLTRPAEPGPRVYSERQLAEARRYTDADYEEVKRNLYPPKSAR